MTPNQEFSTFEQFVLQQTGSIYVQFRLDHCKFMKGDCNQAAVLSYLLNKLRMKLRNPKDKEFLKKCDLWFRCPAKNIRKDFCLGKRKQENSIKKLVQNQIIYTRKGKGNFLWVKINQEKLKEIESTMIIDPESTFGTAGTNYQNVQNVPSDGAKREVQTSLFVPSYISNNLLEESNSEKRRPPSAGEFKEDQFHGDNGDSQENNGKLEGCRTMAIYFWNELKKRGKLEGKRKVSVKGWTDDFNKGILDLMKSRGDSRKEVEESVFEVLKDHVKYIDHQYQPVAHSPNTFLEKFVEIKRAKKHRSNIPPKPLGPHHYKYVRYQYQKFLEFSFPKGSKKTSYGKRIPGLQFSSHKVVEGWKSGRAIARDDGNRYRKYPIIIDPRDDYCGQLFQEGYWCKGDDGRKVFIEEDDRVQRLEITITDEKEWKRLNDLWDSAFEDHTLTDEGRAAFDAEWDKWDQGENKYHPEEYKVRYPE